MISKTIKKAEVRNWPGIEIMKLQIGKGCQIKTNAAIKRDILPLLSKLAGGKGFEPLNAGTKTRCLTTWPTPNEM